MGSARRATLRKAYEHLPPKMSGPFVTQSELKQRFSAVLLRFTAKDLARASGCSVDAAKSWKNGERFPHGDALINLASTLEPINSWLRGETRLVVNSPHANSRHADMVEQSVLPGPDGDAARAYLRAWRRS